MQPDGELSHRLRRLALADPKDALRLIPTRLVRAALDDADGADDHHGGVHADRPSADALEELRVVFGWPRGPGESLDERHCPDRPRHRVGAG